MAKGNHVFNHFNKTVGNAFTTFLVAAGVQVNLATALASSNSVDATTLLTRYPKAWPKFKEIANSAHFAHWDEMQDDQDVAADDANSLAYGKAAASFVAEVKKLAGGQSGSAGNYWGEMLNVGYDGDAAERYINLSAQKREERRKLVTQSGVWVKGPLNSMVCTWLQYLKLDVAGKK